MAVHNLSKVYAPMLQEIVDMLDTAKLTDREQTEVRELIVQLKTVLNTAAKREG
jgi:hypothetical protein